jgi:hypothetical protein
MTNDRSRSSRDRQAYQQRTAIWLRLQPAYDAWQAERELDVITAPSAIRAVGSILLIECLSPQGRGRSRAS